MKKQRLITLMIVLLCALLLTGNVLAMSSGNYALDWFTPLTGGGGGVSSSANYAANFTVGQSVIGEASSTNYGAGLGYWYGVEWFGELIEWFIHLPIIMR